MKKKSVWVIEDGEYSDYRVVGVYSSKKNAKAAQRFHGCGEVAEWPLDPHIDEINAGYSAYLLHMLRDGTVERIVGGRDASYLSTPSIWQRTKAPAYAGKGIPDCLYGDVLAKDEKHAIKIFNEIRTRMIAERQWP